MEGIEGVERKSRRTGPPRGAAPVFENNKQIGHLKVVLRLRWNLELV
jgi:hypothetical protein